MKVSSVPYSDRKPLSMWRSRLLAFSIVALSLTSAATVARTRIFRAQAPLKLRSASSPLSCGDHLRAL